MVVAEFDPPDADGTGRVSRWGISFQSHRKHTYPPSPNQGLHDELQRPSGGRLAGQRRQIHRRRHRGRDIRGGKEAEQQETRLRGGGGGPDDLPRLRRVPRRRLHGGGTALVGLLFEIKVYDAENEEHAFRIAKAMVGKALGAVPLKLVETEEMEGGGSRRPVRSR